MVLDTIPVIGAGQRVEAKRFIPLIDTFYDGHVKLIASAEAEPAELYAGSEGFVAFDSSAPHRVSLKRSADYLTLPHGPVGSVHSLAISASN